jgi:hypothetical protein
MALNGRLEDLALADILHVVGRSRLSGQLRIRDEIGLDATIRFREGRVVLADLGQEADEPALSTVGEDEEVPQGIVETLRLLLRLRGGSFEFSLAEGAAGSLAAGDGPGGMDARRALLDLVREAAETSRDVPRPSPRGSRRVDLGDRARMAEFRRRLDDLLAGDGSARYEMGVAFLEMGLVDDAVRELEAAACDPQHTLRCALLLGRCHLERGEPNEAVRWLEAGLGLRGLSPGERQAVRPLLSLAYAAAGRVGAALRLHEQHVREGLGFAASRGGVGRASLAGSAQVLPFQRTGTGD